MGSDSATVVSRVTPVTLQGGDCESILGRVSAGTHCSGLVAVSLRSRAFVVCAGLFLALLPAGVGEAAVGSALDPAAAEGALPSAHASVVRRCRAVRVVLKRDGRVVKRKGKPVFRRVRRCKRVPGPGCRFVKVAKRTKSGKVVKRRGKTVHINVERCPPKPVQPKVGAPAPQPAPVPAPASQPGPVPAPASQPGPVPDPPSDLANKALALAQHVPWNINLFTSLHLPGPWDGFYPAGSAMAPGDRPPPSETEAREQLNVYLEGHLADDPRARAAALAIYDGADAKAMVAAPLLRAALAGLTGTLLEPTIDHLLSSGRFAEVRFAPLGPTRVAGVTVPSGGGPATIVFNSRYSGEPFEHLIATMGHEILHDDALVSGPEESVNYALTAMVNMQLLSRSPKLARGGSELARTMNTWMLQFINSRESGSPDSKIYAPTGLGTAPGSDQSTTDLWAYALLPGIGGGDASTPRAAPLESILESVLRAGTAIPATGSFDQATAEVFGSLGDKWLTDVQRAQISVLLQIVTVDEVAAAAGIGAQQVIGELALQPYLDAIGG